MRQPESVQLGNHVTAAKITVDLVSGRRAHIRASDISIVLDLPPQPKASYKGDRSLIVLASGFEVEASQTAAEVETLIDAATAGAGGFSATSDFFLEVAKGNVAGHANVLFRGHNPSQTAASGFVDIAEQGDLTYLTSAETMEIASSSTSDAAAGVGLRTLLVQGVDGTGAAIEETVILNGTSDVQTVNSYLRVNFLLGLTAGSTGWNVGSVTATATTAGTIQAEMDATESINQGSHYTVPLAKTLYLLKIELNAAKIVGGGSPEIEFKAYSRSGGDGAAWVQFFDKRMDTDVTDEIDVDFAFPKEGQPARSDIRMRGDTDTNSTEVRTRLYGILVDDVAA